MGLFLIAVVLFMLAVALPILLAAWLISFVMGSLGIAHTWWQAILIAAAMWFAFRLLRR